VRCPDERELFRLAEGELVGDERTRLEAHLDDCLDCLRLIAELARSDAPQAATAPDALRRGDTVGRYVILQRLGGGVMGVVYSAYDPRLDRRVALKLLRGGRAAAELYQPLLREARAMARLSHPHVVAVHDVGLEADQAFIAMEYVEGTTLTEWLAVERPWREALAMFLAAGRGLAAAHAAGLVHRDFKPDNVLVGSRGEVRVSDFGGAHPSRDGASFGVVGTPHRRPAPAVRHATTTWPPSRWRGAPPMRAPISSASVWRWSRRCRAGRPS
jgi:serine/threonine protein kinase